MNRQQWTKEVLLPDLRKRIGPAKACAISWKQAELIKEAIGGRYGEFNGGLYHVEVLTTSRGFGIWFPPTESEDRMRKLERAQEIDERIYLRWLENFRARAQERLREEEETLADPDSEPEELAYARACIPELKGELAQYG